MGAETSECSQSLTDVELVPNQAFGPTVSQNPTPTSPNGLASERHPGMLSVADCMSLAGLSVSGAPWLFLH